MKRCPKCNLSIPNNAKKCKYCGISIKKATKDYVEDIPKIIQEPNKITETENLENTSKIKVNIPLKVKPVTSPKEIIDEKNSENIKLKIFSSFKIILVVLLLIVNIIFIVKIITDKEETLTPEKIKEVEHTTSEVLGNWRSSNNSLFAFEDNKNFFWYEYYDDLKDNYYSGTYNYKKGEDALKEMGYTIDEFYITFGNNINLENVYSINLIPNYVYKAGKNVTNKELKENESWWYILMIKNDGTAISYNKTLDLRYNLVKN